LFILPKQQKESSKESSK